MKEIYEAYRAKEAEAQAQTDAIDAKINAKRQKLERLEKSIEKLREQRERIPSVSWYDGIVVPLAERLAAATGLEYVIYGPFGMDCETSIYLVKDKKVSITKQPTKGLTLRPRFREDDSPYLAYWAGDETQNYAKGTFGDLMGLNLVFVPLPEAFDEVLQLLRTTGASE
ncbi:MAG: hypothetical protein NC311_18940 [Muribaculaceae bacterium]|nr:hypothetical protein [Muribaculaceae bacterium]